MSALRKTSVLFGNMGKLVARNKSTFQYEADKTFAQRWVDKQVLKQKELQKLYGAEDGTPMWFKSSGDRILTLLAFVGVTSTFCMSLHGLVNYARGK